MAAHGPEQRRLQPAAAARADDDQLRASGLRDEGVGRIPLDEPRLEVLRLPVGERVRDRGVQLGLGARALGVELTGQVARGHRDHPGVADRGQRHEGEDVDRYHPCLAESRLGGRPAQRLARSVGPVDADDDRPGHAPRVRHRAR